MSINASSVNLCPHYGIIGNGFCDFENNNAFCNYDGGDCCPNFDLINNEVCDYVNYNHGCLYDGGDCCFEYSGKYGHHINTDKQCSFIHNHEMCNFDGGDCCNNVTIADGICDDINNNRLCRYDGGDCCFGKKNTTRCSLCKCINVFDVILVLPFMLNVLFSNELHFHP